MAHEGTCPTDDGPRFCVLGPVGATTGERVLTLGGPGLRGLLAMLLLEPNQIVPVDRIVDVLWDHEPPATARTIVQGYISRLRKWLVDIDPTEQTAIETTGPGYRLVVDEERIDVSVARRLLAEARGKPAIDRADLLACAQGLWRGPELSDIGGRVRAPELAELRLTVIEARIDADLELGRHDEVIGELAALVDTHPFREHLVGQLVLALYRSGRRAAALEIYQRFAHRAAGELGLDPGPGLRELHSRVLRDDNTLLRPRPIPVVTPRIGVLTPAQLPAAPPGFAGREDELAWIDGVRASGDGTAPPVGVLAGPPGIGKSALALHWAARAARWFPDGQLYAQLRGFDDRDSPVDPTEVLARFLLALGVAPEDVPGDLTDRAVLFRSLLANRRVLVLLDDAHSSDQVRPLLPAGGSSLVLVTSRRRLGGLVTDGARSLVLGTLPADAAERVIEHAAGPALDGEARALRAKLARLCGYLPLALRIVGARLVRSPQWSLTDLVDELSDERTRLAALHTEDASVRAAFDITYRSLDEGQARTLRLLGTFPGQWVSPCTVAAMEGTDMAGARARLAALTESFLVVETDRDVFGMHDLVRLHARDLVEDKVGPLRHVLRHYVVAADIARRLIGPVTDDIDALAEWPDAPRPDLGDRDAAVEWFELEWTNLRAVAAAGAQAGCHDEVWRLARVATEFRRVRARRDDWEWLVGLGLAAAEAAGDRRGQVWAHLSQCLLLTRFHQVHAAATSAERALAIATDLGDNRLMAVAHHTLANAHHDQKNYVEALDGFQRALALARAADDRLGAANALNNIARVHRSLDNPGDAVDPQKESVDLFRAEGDPDFVGMALVNLAELEHHLGRSSDATEHLKEAVALAAEHGLILTEAFGREMTARILRDTGDVLGARAEFGMALTLFERAQSTSVKDVREALASLPEW